MDNLPAATKMIAEMADGTKKDMYDRGFRLGFIGSKDIPGTEPNKPYINNHLRFIVKCVFGSPLRCLRGLYRRYIGLVDTTHTHTHMQHAREHTHTHTYTHARTHTPHTHTHTHTREYTYAHTHTHTRVRARTHARARAHTLTQQTAGPTDDPKHATHPQPATLYRPNVLSWFGWFPTVHNVAFLSFTGV